MTERILDARWLEPPEPMDLALEAIGGLESGEHLRLLIHRTPHMLFPILAEWGFNYRTHSLDDGTYEIFIWPKGASAPDGELGMS